MDSVSVFISEQHKQWRHDEPLHPLCAVCYHSTLSVGPLWTVKSIIYNICEVSLEVVRVNSQ